MACHSAAAIDLVELDEPVRGIWCPRCQLPSGIAGTFAVVTAVDTAPVGVVRAATCLDCEACLAGRTRP